MSRLIGQRWSLVVSGLLCLLLLPVLLTGCMGAGTTATVPTLPVLQLPAMLAGYHIYVSDLETGDVAELGIHTTHISESIHGLGLSADGKTLYISDVRNNQLVAMPLMNGHAGVTHAAPTGLLPVHMVNTLDGSTIFVTNFDASSISVIDATTWKHLKDITVPDRPHAIVLSPDGRFAYAACYGGHAIAVIDVSSESLAGIIQTPPASQPYGIAISADGHYVYASDNLTGRVFVIDARTRTYLGAVQVGNRPALIARSPDGKRLYVANGASHSVSVLDITTDPAHPQVIGQQIAVDGYPHGLAVTPDGHYVVVANTLGDTLSVIDTSTDQKVATIAGEKYPNDVLITG